MRRRSAWKIENYTYRECPHPDREFGYAVSLHNHSCHSVEKLAALNQVVKLTFMRPLSGVLQKSFGLGGVSDLNYAEITFNPPYTPEDVYQMEAAAAANWGFQGVHLAITDHDEFAGSLALLRSRPDLNGRIALSEELSLWFQGHLFHLGMSHMPESEVEETHTQIQAAARGGRYDELFEILAASGCLVVLNHPLVAWDPRAKTPGAETIPVTDLLSRYGWAIHALEVNGMRPREENDGVLELARHWRKPVVGGGDSHLLVPSSVLSLSRAATFKDFIAEVKDGHAVPFVTPDYFAPLKWKLILASAVFHLALPANCQLQGTTRSRHAGAPQSSARSGGLGESRISGRSFRSGIGPVSKFFYAGITGPAMRASRRGVQSKQNKAPCGALFLA